MEKLISVAGYIYQRYEKDYGSCIDEMKLHKLMYFSQRESFIQTGEPLFEGLFHAWKFGPILKEIRQIYKIGDFTQLQTATLDIKPNLETIFSIIFSEYAIRDSWSLSKLTHNEYSWKNARKDIPENENCDNEIENKDILVDANRIKERRLLFTK